MLVWQLRLLPSIIANHVAACVSGPVLQLEGSLQKLPQQPHQRCPLRPLQKLDCVAGTLAHIHDPAM